MIKLKLKLKQYLCIHNYEHIAVHKSASENLWKCRKCGVYYIQHWGLGIGYKYQTPDISGWIYKEGKE